MLVLLSLAMSLTGGGLFGYSAGFVAPYLDYVGLSGDCLKMKSNASCESLGKCRWNRASVGGEVVFACRHRDTIDAPCELNSMSSPAQSAEVMACTNNARCYYDPNKSECIHRPTWEPWQQGLFAAGMIVGSLLGSIVAPLLLARLAVENIYLVCFCVGAFTSVTFTVGQMYSAYWVLLVDRVLLGLPIGILCTAVPIHVSVYAPPAYKDTVALFMQVFITLFIFIAAGVGYILVPANYQDPINIGGKFTVLIAIQYALCALPLAIYWFLRHIHRRRESKSIEIVTQEEGKNTWREGTEENGGTLKRRVRDGIRTIGILRKQIVTAVFLCIGLQFTGINAVINYAPVIFKNVGVPQLLGNMLVTLATFLSTLISLVVIKKLSPQAMFIGGVVAASVSLLLCSVSLMPAVLSAGTAQSVLVLIGIFSFVGAFNIGIGSSFWIHAHSIFPVDYKNVGCSFIIAVQFILNIVINACFPIALAALSGNAPSSPFGISILFLVFSIFGAITSIVLWRNF